MAILESLLIEQRAHVEELERNTGLAYWKASLSGSKEDEETASALASELNIRYSSKETYNALLALEEPASHDLRRQRRLLINSFKAHQFSPEVIVEVTAREMEIESLFANFRADLQGEIKTDNQLQRIFKESEDSDLRRHAWEASKQIGAAAVPKVLELIRLRNELAQSLGYQNYYSMAMDLQELDEDAVFALLDEVSDKLKLPFTRLKSDIDRSIATRFGISVDEVMPWHYSNPFFQDAPDDEDVQLDGYFEGKDLEMIARQFFREIGFDVDRLLRNSDLYEKPGKMQHAYCTSIGRGTHDVRVLCNIVPNARWMATLLHELGHAVYDDLIDDDLPFFLKQVTHMMTTEAVAELMGRFVNNGSWLQRYAGVGADDAERVETASRNTNRAHLLIFTQWVLVMAHFERELYRDPDQNLGKLWWDLVEKYQQVRRPSGERPTDWAAKIHLSTAPVYYHNYLLGEMTASQILSALKRDTDLSDADVVSSDKVGYWLTKKIFESGARYDWNELLQRATGEPLNPDYFTDCLV